MAFRYKDKNDSELRVGFILFHCYICISAVRLTTGTLVINIIYFVLLDRLMMAAVQRRTGPYNVGYFGLLKSMDDGLKLVKNEVIIPKKYSCILFLVVPNLFFYFSLIL